jgi:hypothetical protein
MKRSDEKNLSRLSHKQESKSLSPPELKKLTGLLGKKKMEREGARKKKSKNAPTVVGCAASGSKLAGSSKQATKLEDVDYCKVWKQTIEQLRIRLTFDDRSTVEFRYDTQAELLRDFESWTRRQGPGKN